MSAIKLISPEECRRRMEADGTIQLIDVRTPAEYARMHAAGATLVPIDQLDPLAIKSQLAGQKREIFVICHSGGRSAKACERLVESGIGHVHSVDGGTEAWRKQGLPVVHPGGKMISLERQVRIAAGALVLTGLILAWTVSVWFTGLSAFVGAGLMFAGITDFCGMGMLLAKMPWNRREPAACKSAK